MDIPPFDRSQMDGFAIRAEDVANAPVELDLVGESAAGKGWHHELKAGQAVRIMTGAPVPQGANAVQKVELTSEANFISDASQRVDGKITISEAVDADKNVVHRGEEVQKGDVVLRAGERVSERMVATLAAFGYANVTASVSPKVAILTTGSEVVGVDETPGADQIRNSNSWMLAALVTAAGGKATVLPSASDDIEPMKAAIARACESSEMVVITGGVSVGKYDLTKAALRELGAEILFERVKLKPGKPAVFARLGQTIVFGLPGNPVSAAVTFYLFVRRALLLMQKATETELPRGKAVSQGVLRAAKERDTYLPVKAAIGRDAQLTVSPVKWIGSSDFIGFGKSDTLAFVAAGQTIEAGEIVEVFLL
jgi:molybdenum cofactor synthesis domain-containing protein